MCAMHRRTIDQIRPDWLNEDDLRDLEVGAATTVEEVISTPTPMLRMLLAGWREIEERDDLNWASMDALRSVLQAPDWDLAMIDQEIETLEASIRRMEDDRRELRTRAFALREARERKAGKTLWKSPRIRTKGGCRYG